MTKKIVNEDIVIIGSGMAGSGAAYRLTQEGVHALMLDKNDHSCGQTASYTFENKYVFDNGPHISFTSDERVRELFAKSLDYEFWEIPVAVNNYWRGHWVKHPAQCHLYGLPADEITRCLVDFIQVHNHPPKEEPKNYAQWLIGAFGETFARDFPMQYGQRYHTATAENMNLVWMGNRLYKPKLEEVLYGAVSPSAPNVHYVQKCRYPKNGGFQSFQNLFQNMAHLRLEHNITHIDPIAKRIDFAHGASQMYQHLISSMPLPELIARLPNVPANVQKAAQLLACTQCVLVNIVIDRQAISDYHWTYIYDDDISFTRLSFPHMQSPNNVPKGCGSFQAELYFSNKYRPVDKQNINDYIADVKRDLMRIGLLKENDQVLFENAWLLPYANVIFDLDQQSCTKIVHEYLDSLGIVPCGRYGDWGYMWTDESFKSGERAAQTVLDRL